MCSPLNRARLLVNTLIVSGATLVTIALIFVLGPIYEGKYFPVTSDVVVHHIRNEGDKMLFQAYGVKNRDCKLVDVKSRVDKYGVGVYNKSVIYVVNDGEGDAIRPIGAQDLGIWAVIPVSKSIEVQTWYQCHRFWNTYQVLGTWPEAEIEVEQ